MAECKISPSAILKCDAKASYHNSAFCTMHYALQTKAAERLIRWLFCFFTLDFSNRQVRFLIV